MQKKRADARRVLIAAVLLAFLSIVVGALFLIAPVWQPGYQPAAYRAAEPPTAKAAATAHTKSAATVVHINTATQEELEALPGVGPAKAQAICAYRTLHGSFSSLEEVAAVKGISESMVQSWADAALVD